MENMENELNRIQDYAETILDVVAELRVLASDVPTKQGPAGAKKGVYPCAIGPNTRPSWNALRS
jgi:hypothetical protein